MKKLTTSTRFFIAAFFAAATMKLLNWPLRSALLLAYTFLLFSQVVDSARSLIWDSYNTL